jgi:hypothetical protein
MDETNKISLLAKSICDCPEVARALNDVSHPCNKVVAVQNAIASVDPELRQRPEPWIGNIGDCKLLFLSSNPGISDDPVIEHREDFPTYRLSPEESADFFVNRFNQKNIPIHATFRHPTEPDFLVRCFDGEYRSGMKKEKQSQSTWKGIHAMAVDVLGNQCDPNKDYALTEIVHCKSKMAEGVSEASEMCVNNWLPRILGASSAKVIVIVGSKVRDNFAIPQLNFREDFGSDKQKVYKSLSKQERAIRDIQISNFGGFNRLYFYTFHPTHAISPNRLQDMYGEEVVLWIQRITSGRDSLPTSDSSLKELLIQFTSKP